MPGRFALRESRPLARPESVLAGDHWRITVLLDGLLRLEWSDDGGFEDRASTFAVYREHPTPAFTVRESDEQLEILTDRLQLTWDRRPFSSAGLLVRVRGAISAHRATWRWGTAPHTLGGTGRTLDDVDGAIALEDGVVSQDGIAVLDDSTSFLFTDAGWIDRRVPGRHDVYVFAYGHDYPDAVRALYAVSGPPPVLPRWALGNWWSRYHAYSASEYLELMDRFDAERVPFSVAVLDMDWHRVESVPSQYGTGWTGYSWELPEGIWADIFTGAVYRAGAGGQRIHLHRDDRSIPVLLRAGAVLPLAQDPGTRPDTNPAALELLMLPGADGLRELVEDDGTGDRVSRTPLRWDDTTRTLTIGPASDPSVVPAQRDWTIRVLGEAGTVSITGAPTNEERQVPVRREPAPDDKPDRLFDLLARAQWAHVRKLAAWTVLAADVDDLRKVSGLEALNLPESLLSALLEIIVSG